MLSRLEGRRPATKHDVLDDLTAAIAVARKRLAVFEPTTAPSDEPVVRDQRRRA